MVKNRNIKLSIVVPIYNTSIYLRDCIDSILKNKGLSKVEIILVNDGSTDDSGAICEEYVNGHGDIIKYIHTDNGGLSEARNNGLKIASGDMVWFVDSDDEIANNAISLVLREAKGHDISIIDYAIIEDNKTTKMPFDDVDDSVKKYLINTPIVPIRIFRRSFLNNIKFSFTKEKYYEDSGSMYGLVRHTKDIAYIDKVLYFYKKRTGSITLDGKIAAKSGDRYWATDEILRTVPDDYKDERNYQAIKTLGLFYTFDVLGQMVGRERKLALNEARSYLEKNIPNYWNNPYIKRKSMVMRGYRLYLYCLHIKRYSLCGAISMARRKLLA